MPLRVVLFVLVALVLLASCKADRAPADKWKVVEACGYKFRVPTHVSSARSERGMESDCGILPAKPHPTRGRFGGLEL